MVDTLPHTIMYGIAGWQIGVWGNKLYNWIMSRTVDPYEETEEGQESYYVPSLVIHKINKKHMKNSDLTPIDSSYFLVAMFTLLIAITSCKSTKTNCDAYGDLKKQHDAYRKSVSRQ